MADPALAAGVEVRSTREVVLSALRSGAVDVRKHELSGRYLLVMKVDDDSISDRRVTFHRSKAEARAAIRRVPPGWWPDCVIDLKAPASWAVRDAAVGDGGLGKPYPFDADHVIFA